MVAAERAVLGLRCIILRGNCAFSFPLNIKVHLRGSDGRRVGKRRKSFHNKTNTVVDVKIRNLIHVELFHPSCGCIPWLDWWRCLESTRRALSEKHSYTQKLSGYSIRGISSSFPRLAHCRCRSNLNFFHASSICKFDKLRHKFSP